MIRIFLATGIIGGLVIAYLTVFAVGPISQLPPPKSLLARYRAEGVVPANVNLPEDETAEELEVFEVPEQDEVMLRKIRSQGGSMPGMNMPGMNMDSSKTMNMNGDRKTPMKMGGDTASKMPMNGDKKTPMDMSGNTAGNMPMDGNKKMPMDMGKGGLLVKDDGEFDREITLTMQEWKFSNMMIKVKPGERIKFTVRNGGQIPHEFMFMDMPLMTAVNYRATRADWNLLEHEALFEKSLVLPGGEFSFVLKVTRPGAWMFMCMLPYHMKMGMMGQMATKGMAMDMKM